MDDLCIIGQAGGVRSSYYAGVIKGLINKFGLVAPKNIVGVSGSAANFSYFVSKQHDLIEKIWIDLVKSGEFIKWTNLLVKGEPVIDIDYLIDTTLKQHYPLDISAFRSASTNLYVGVTRHKDGTGRYFSNRDKDIDPYELIRASCAIPYFYGREVGLVGERFVDGTISCLFGQDKALSLKPKKLLVVFTTPPGLITKAYFVRKILRFLLIRDEPKALQDEIWLVPERTDKFRDNANKLFNGIHFVSIFPNKALPIKRLGWDIEALKYTIAQGEKDVYENNALNDFFA